jgi:ribosomal protein S12 methylthiotransferase accessory factor
MEDILDARFGPIRAIHAICGQKPEPKWWVYQCELSRPFGESFSLEPNYSAGCSIIPEEAFRKAIWEGIERYCAINSFRFADLKKASLKRNPLTAHLPRCAKFEQCIDTFKDFPLETPVTQAKVLRLASSREEWLPASIVHLTFEKSPGEPELAHSISTGLAFHKSLKQAIWAGLLECAERHAVMSFWWLKKAKKIEFFRPGDSTILTQMGSLNHRLKVLRESGLEVFLFDITTNFRVPSVFCLIKSERKPFYVAGASCHPDITHACIKAIDEAMSLRIQFNPVAESAVELPSLADFSWLVSLQQRLDLYSHWKNSSALDFLFSDELSSTSLEDMQQQEWWQEPQNMTELQSFAQRMEDKDFTILYADITQDDIREYGSCAKVIVPQMVPLSPCHSSSWLGTKSLAKAAGKDALLKSDLNPFPHPFA